MKPPSGHGLKTETEVIHAVLDALKPETPATDRIVAETEARGVEKGIAHPGEEVQQYRRADH